MVRGKGVEGSGGGQRGDKWGQKETLLEAMDTQSSVQMIRYWVIHWNWYGLVSQCHPNNPIFKKYRIGNRVNVILVTMCGVRRVQDLLGWSPSELYNVSSLGCVLETNIILYVNCNWKIEMIKNKSYKLYSKIVKYFCILWMIAPLLFVDNISQTAYIKVDQIVKVGNCIHTKTLWVKWKYNGFPTEHREAFLELPDFIILAHEKHQFKSQRVIPYLYAKLQQ